MPVVFVAAAVAGVLARLVAGRGVADILVVLGVALCASAVAVVLAARGARTTSRRLEALAADMAQVAAGDTSHRSADPADDEVGYLVRYFNLMADSLDQTDRELREKTVRLETALQNRQLLDRAKDEFMVLISHEVRTPLTAIMGGVDILKGQIGAAGPDELALLESMNMVEVLKIIESNGRRLRGFMNDAIQMTTIQSSDHQLRLGAESMENLVELGLCGVREMAQLRGVSIRNELEGRQDWQVLCDTRVLTLAFERILKNAVVHNRDGGEVVVRTSDRIPGVADLVGETTAEDVHRLMSQESFADFRQIPIAWKAVEIFNTGEAIPAERCEALFTKFELVGRIEHHQRGSGLSLPIAQAAVAQHGGRVYVHGEKGVGNSFFLLLPTVATASVEQARHGVGGGAGHEQVDPVADPATLEVELDHVGPGLPGGTD